MAKLKGKGVVIAGLVAGAASYLSKKENRDKVMSYIQEAKVKATAMMDGMKDKAVVEDDTSLQDIAETAASPDTTDIRENNMIAEGAQTAVQYYNENDQEDPIEERLN
ncbi:hypothetical protein P9B03_19785 [Metasolibacillus meyeri]|uniref:YtxH domain-containing protein n=1 Tax=Metasolibacillus meyeri TaxID=1071052 RepID=A0AAW9NYP1_9BACL|nr:hypothetical protein [Metasolibacillus meyeri]MEC1180701.1 hypothetical protein [Metasolibacillus meyeri]